jgi:hypothetical protein
MEKRNRVTWGKARLVSEVSVLDTPKNNHLRSYLS